MTHSYIYETFKLVILGHKKGACGILELVIFELRFYYLFLKKIEQFLWIKLVSETGKDNKTNKLRRSIKNLNENGK